MSFILGTAQFGDHQHLTIKEIHNILLTAHRLGIRRLDTGTDYGESIYMIGQFRKKFPAYNFQIILKINFPKIDSQGPKHGLLTPTGRDYLDKTLDHFFRNLGITRVDTLLLDDFHQFEVQSLWNWMSAVPNVSRLGLSVTYPWEITRAIQSESVKHIQLPFNLFSVPEISKHLSLPELVREKKKLTPGFRIEVHNVFAKGLLVNLDYQVWKKVPNMTSKIFEKYVATLETLKTNFKRQSLADLAISYVRHFSWIDGIVIGCDTVQEVEENNRLFKLKPLDIFKVKIAQEILLPLIMETPLILDPTQWDQD